MTKEQHPRFFYGWKIVATSTLLSFAQTTTFNPILSVFIKPMTLELGWSRAAISGAVSAGSFVGGLLSFVIGPVVDRRGAKAVLVASASILGFCLILLAHFSALWQFYLLFGLGRALSVGIIEVSALVTVSNWFIRRRGRAIGMVNSGTRMGQALLPLFAQMLILARGWRWGWIGLALIAWALGILPTALFMKRRPEDLGLLPDGESTDPTISGASSNVRLEPVWTARVAISTSAFWLITAAFAQTFMATGGINLHQFPHLTDVGISPSIAVGAITTVSLCATVGGIFWPTLAEKLDVRYCLAIALVISALGVFILMSVRGVPLAYVYAVTYGLTYGGLFPLFGLAQANYFGRTSLATIRGLAQPFLMTSNALGPFLAGWIYDLTRSYQVAFGVFIVAYLMSVVWVLLARPPVIRDEPVRASP